MLPEFYQFHHRTKLIYGEGLVNDFAHELEAFGVKNYYLARPQQNWNRRRGPKDAVSGWALNNNMNDFERSNIQVAVIGNGPEEFIIPFREVTR